MVEELDDSCGNARLSPLPAARYRGGDCSRCPISARSLASISAMAVSNSSSSADSSSRTRARAPCRSECADAYQLDDRSGVVSPVSRTVPPRLCQQPLGVIVPHRTHGNPGACGDFLMVNIRPLSACMSRFALPQVFPTPPGCR